MQNILHTICRLMCHIITDKHLEFNTLQSYIESIWNTTIEWTYLLQSIPFEVIAIDIQLQYNYANDMHAQLW